ncbi:MAG: hypothetical protein FJ100_18705 [Deltaproteobacteria bacterium]|nr:hypothetical protein [Deltaproteobacteria bacterium]
MAVALGPACARLATDTALRADVLEKPRKATVSVGERIAVDGRRTALRVDAETWTEKRCAEELRQNARGWLRTSTRAVGHSLAAEWLFGGVLTAAGVGLTAAVALHTPEADEAPAAQTSRYLATGAVGVVGVALLVAATVQTASLGVSERDLGVKELVKRVRETACGRSPRPHEALRLTLCDGKQLEAISDAAGRAVFALPEDVDDRIASEGSDRAILEARFDPRSQRVLHLAVAVTDAGR